MRERRTSSSFKTPSTGRPVGPEIDVSFPQDPEVGDEQERRGSRRNRAAVLGISEATGQTLRERARSTLEETARPVTIEAEELGGSGGDWIVEAASSTRASSTRPTLIGKSHLTAETPAFSAALLRDLAPTGYSTYVLRSGPVATRLVMEAIEEAGIDEAERELTGDETAVAFDLGPLRALLNQTSDKSEEMQELEELALRFDAVVMLPRFHQADAVVPLPER